MCSCQFCITKFAFFDKTNEKRSIMSFKRYQIVTKIIQFLLIVELSVMLIVALHICTNCININLKHIVLLLAAIINTAQLVVYAPAGLHPVKVI